MRGRASSPSWPPVTARRFNPCKILGKRDFCKIRRFRTEKIPLFSMADFLTLQIFPNLFLREMGEINALRAKKFGFVDFLDFAASFAALGLWIEG
jgi:hypothetical protein